MTALFATGNVSVVGTGPSQTAFANALTFNGLNPAAFGGVTGQLVYESTAAGNGGSPAQAFNGAVDSLSFSVAGWFSQSLSGMRTNVATNFNGDITVTNDGSAQLDLDSINVTVTCRPGLNNTTQTTCTATTFNFNYSITAQDGTIWALDQFVLLLQEATAAPNPLPDNSLPDPGEWLSTQWTTRRVDLRFNPSCVPPASGDNPCANVTERATISFLAIPEPGSLALVGLALAGAAQLRRRTGSAAGR